MPALAFEGKNKTTFFKQIPKVFHVIILSYYLVDTFKTMEVSLHKIELYLEGDRRVDDRNDVETSIVSKNQMVYVARHVQNAGL